MNIRFVQIGQIHVQIAHLLDFEETSNRCFKKNG